MTANKTPWPQLPFAPWKDTCETLHLYTQVVGKVRLVLSPMMNQWWQVPFYLTSRGLTTSPVPYGSRTFELEFDFIDHNLILRTSNGATHGLALVPRPVCEFHHEVLGLLHSEGLDVTIDPMPSEIPGAIPFTEDRRHCAYDAEAAHRFWEVLRRADTVFKEFRGRFTGKCSPVHFFWGSFDLAVSRFSGRHVPTRPGADTITREGYNEEVISLGFWPGSEAMPEAVFYVYAAPEPNGFAAERVRPTQAFYDGTMKEFFLRYDDVRRSAAPAETILEFAQSAYEAAARLADWNRPLLERITTRAIRED